MYNKISTFDNPSTELPSHLTEIYLPSDPVRIITWAFAGNANEDTVMYNLCVN